MNNNVEIRKVRLSTIQDIKDFCYTMNTFPRNISIKVKHDNFVSDAKSILDMIALNLSNPVDIIFESTDTLDSTRIENAISKWEV